MDSFKGELVEHTAIEDEVENKCLSDVKVCNSRIRISLFSRLHFAFSDFRRKLDMSAPYSQSSCFLLFITAFNSYHSSNKRHHSSNKRLPQLFNTSQLLSQASVSI